jgi:hypothetical protein
MGADEWGSRESSPGPADESPSGTPAERPRGPGRFARAYGTPPLPDPPQQAPGPAPYPDDVTARSARLLVRVLPLCLLLAVVPLLAVDDAVGRLLAVRRAVSVSDGVGHAELRVPPGTAMYLTVRRTHVTPDCRIRQAGDWVPLPPLTDGGSVATWLPVSWAPTRRSHEFFALEPVTAVRCTSAVDGGTRALRGVQLWRESPPRHVGYQALVLGVRGLWLLACLAVLWRLLPGRRRERHRRPDAGTTRSSP